MGLRELKKEQTRQAIADAAWRMFADRGFDHVTVAEVARAAQVAEATLFNYFPAKEDLFYSGLETFGGRLVDAVGSRAPGESAVAAFRRFLLDGLSALEEVETGDEALERLRTVNRVIADSPALRAREQQSITRITDSLAEQLAYAPADRLTAQVVANALMGVHRALTEHVRRRVLAEGRPTGLAAEVRDLAVRAFARLEHGLGDYAGGPATDELPRRSGPT